MNGAVKIVDYCSDVSLVYDAVLDGVDHFLGALRQLLRISLHPKDTLSPEICYYCAKLDHSEGRGDLPLRGELEHILSAWWESQQLDLVNCFRRSMLSKDTQQF